MKLDGEALGRVPNDDWIKAGFRWYDGPAKGPGSHYAIWQHRVRDGRGTAYFVDVKVWDWREFPGHPLAWTYSADLQFEAGGRTINIQSDIKTPTEALTFAQEIWTKLGCDHYELSEGRDHG